MSWANVFPVTGVPTRRSKPMRRVSTMALSRFRPVTAIKSTVTVSAVPRTQSPGNVASDQAV